MSPQKLLRGAGLTIGLMAGVIFSSSAASPAPATPLLTEYYTTCQWNGCPTTGNDICFTAWDGHYICTRPYSRDV